MFWNVSLRNYLMLQMVLYQGFIRIIGTTYQILLISQVQFNIKTLHRLLICRQYLEILVLSQNGLNYDYHFIIKELASEGQFECLGENTKWWKTFSVPIKRHVTNIDKDGNESVINISEESKFIDSARFMASPLAKLFDNLTEGIQKLNEKIIISFFNMKVLRIT